MLEREPSRAWVTQCALSRICGECGDSLGRPVAFVGTVDERARNAFHLPPLHEACARAVRDREAYDVVVRTSGFEFVRPTRDDLDRSPRFEPNSLLD